MKIHIPPVSAIKSHLETLTHADIQMLAVDSKVPFTTLWKIRSGETSNPGIETVRKFVAHFKNATSKQPKTQGATHA